MFCFSILREGLLLHSLFFSFKLGFINYFVYICLILIFKTDKMETQDITLQKEIRGLEKALKNAVYNGDAFEQMALHKKLEVAKSTLLNIK